MKPMTAMKLVVVSNRLPVALTRNAGGEVRVEPSNGGEDSRKAVIVASRAADGPSASKLPEISINPAPIAMNQRFNRRLTRCPAPARAAVPAMIQPASAPCRA